MLTIKQEKWSLFYIGNIYDSDFKNTIAFMKGFFCFVLFYSFWLCFGLAVFEGSYVVLGIMTRIELHARQCFTCSNISSAPCFDLFALLFPCHSLYISLLIIICQNFVFSISFLSLCFVFLWFLLLSRPFEFIYFLCLRVYKL